MAEFKSKYKKLGFYVNGELNRFADGRFVTEDKEIISVLNKLSDAQRVDVPEEEPKKKKKSASEK
ncbi:hypothetical protein [Cytobacillus firmus]|uniref:hypothetical protein n=1 Tax=Cytobacillus firmus TaxID=1399 RepID=UPI0018CE526E|nr:hypothetical protein [Cytobacillus firmus]MBG9548520.1 hypothetical protein [Cytobacillus firmus]MBG9602943.1 hypothetical protein [Cytobacillus firmus]MBG9654872.1 hypothetical protein [Cytobacillus firmus]MED1906121.1 hypothetical protein [Cytobacillus firmus]MED1941536.1 hypothetical protein [Cytobacillus firmus]